MCLPSLSNVIRDNKINTSKSDQTRRCLQHWSRNVFSLSFLHPWSILKTLHVEWQSSTPHFAFLSERKNKNISFPRVERKPTTIAFTIRDDILMKIVSVFRTCYITKLFWTRDIYQGLNVIFKQICSRKMFFFLYFSIFFC